jgi:hypothetical protein
MEGWTDCKTHGADLMALILRHEVHVVSPSSAAARLLFKRRTITSTRLLAWPP